MTCPLTPHLMGSHAGREKKIFPRKICKILHQNSKFYCSFLLVSLWERKISLQIPKFPWKELPDFHFFPPWSHDVWWYHRIRTREPGLPIRYRHIQWRRQLWSKIWGYSGRSRQHVKTNVFAVCWQGPD